MSEGRLHVCATPIGNLGDISERLREVLGQVDLVYAEDTRRVAKLLSHIGVRVKVRSLFAGNEKERSEELIEHLLEGSSVALVTDAGTPAVSDPGAWVVSLARERGLPVSVIPGPSAVTAALAASGFPGDRFVFEGFLPRRGVERERRFQQVAGEQRTTVLFASPHRLADDLEDMGKHIGPDRLVAVARELTKLHEEVWVGPLSEAIERWSSEVKGEVTLVVAPAEPPEADLNRALEEAKDLVDAGQSVSEVARQVSVSTGVPRRRLYQALIDDSGGSQV